MNITIPRAALSKALDFAAKIAERRTTIPILVNVRLTARDNRLTIAATDLDIEVQTSLEAEVTTPGETTAPAATLADIIRKLAGEKVMFDAAPGEPRLTIKSGRAKFHLAMLDAGDWPTLERGDMTHRFTLPAESLARALKKVSFAISNEETRYYLNGVYLHVTGGADGPALRFVTTDGHRLACLEMPAPEGTPGAGMTGVIIPSKTCAEIARMAETAIKDDKLGRPEFEIELSDRKIAVRCGASALLSKLIDGSFPDYERAIPRQNDKTADVDRDALAGAVSRVATVISERGRAVKFALDDQDLTISVANADIGDASEDLEIVYDGPPIEIGFNAKYVAEALAVLDGDSARFELNDSGSPAILRSAQDSGLLIILMPTRVN